MGRLKYRTYTSVLRDPAFLTYCQRHGHLSEPQGRTGTRQLTLGAVPKVEPLPEPVVPAAGAAGPDGRGAGAVRHASLANVWTPRPRRPQGRGASDVHHHPTEAQRGRWQRAARGLSLGSLAAGAAALHKHHCRRQGAGASRRALGPAHAAAVAVCCLGRRLQEARGRKEGLAVSCGGRSAQEGFEVRRVGTRTGLAAERRACSGRRRSPPRDGKSRARTARRPLRHRSAYQLTALARSPQVCAAPRAARRLSAALPVVFRPPVPKGGAAKPKGPGAVQHSASSAEMADVALRFIQNFQMQVMQRRLHTTP
jgi:hypothetical protein